MKSYLLVFNISFLMLSCTTPSDVIRGEFKNEPYAYYVETKNSPYLTIYIPGVQNRLIDQDMSKKTSKGASCFVPFLSDDDPLRQLQLDNIVNRKDFYSEILQQLTADSTKRITVIAEGLNANIMSHIAFAFPIEHLILVNPYKPSIEQILISTCINENRSATCDSLLDQFRLRDRAQIIQLFESINEDGVDEQIGIYPLPMWKASFRYPCEPRENKYIGRLTYIYTKNSGLAPLKDSLISINNKDLYKRIKETINN